MVQGRAARMVFSDCGRSSSVTPMLQHLQWPTLQECRAQANVTMMYRIIHHLIDIPIFNLTPISSARRPGLSYLVPFAQNSCYQKSFFPGTIWLWNHLPQSLVYFATLDNFRRPNILEAMTMFSRVPVVDIHSDNLREVWPSMILAMSNATFIGLDTELSGLGHRKKLGAKSVEDRYKSICETAKSRSILSLGMSCFQQMAAPSQSSCNGQLGSSYLVQTFNILLLCEEEFVVEPLSLRFLVQHGFDFNKQYEKGIPYYRGVDKKEDKSIQSIRHLFAEIVSMKKPIVLHNGLVDMMFMYENLYTSLPSSSAIFLADICDMFPGGIIDTKYITDFEHRMQASYLEYVFRKCQKDNENLSEKCVVHFPHYPASYPHVTYRNCSIKPQFDINENPQAYKQALCETYAGHGWCSKEKFCPSSHDIDLIIDVDNYMEGRKRRKRERRRQNNAKDESIETLENGDAEPKGSNSEEIMHEKNMQTDDGKNGTNSDIDTKLNCGEILKMLKGNKTDEQTHANGGHRAGYDAFMTGFIYAVFMTESNGLKDKCNEWKNKLYLGGKDYPLSVGKSIFSKHSKQHLEKIDKIRKSDIAQ